MPKTPSYAPAPPDLNIERKVAGGAVFVPAILVLAWGLIRDLAIASKFPYPIPAAPDWRAFILPCVVIVAACAAVAGARVYGYRRALETQQFYDQLARVMKLDPGPARKGMTVHERARLTPVDVTVRVTGEKAARALASGALRTVFAGLTHVDEEKVAVLVTKRGVRLRADRADGDRAPVPARATDDARVDDEPDEAPIPAVPAPSKIADRITQALAGALDTDTATVEIPDTNPADGAPLEVWVTYPARMTSKVGDRLQDVRDTLARVVAPTNDEWTIQWLSHKDRIVLRDALDTLAPTVPLPPLEPDLDLYRGPVLGVTESGEPFRLPLMGNGVAGTLVAGATGSGKGSILWNIIRGVAPLMEQGIVRLWVCDPKGGMELGQLEGLVHRFAVSDGECVLLLQDAHDSMKAKAAEARIKFGRKVSTASRDFPLDLVIIDELASLTDNRSIGKEVEELTSALARQGRAPAFTLVSCTQDPRAKVIPNRSAYTQAVALRLSEAIETDMILGKGARKRGGLADLIPVAHAGIGIVVRDGIPDPIRFRAAFVDDPDIDALTERLREARRTPPELGAPISDAVQPPLDDEPEPAPAPAPAPRKAPRKPPAKKQAPRTADRQHPVSAGQLADLIDLDPVVAIFDGDPDEVTITAAERNEDEPDRVIVTYRYVDSATDQFADLDEGERITVLSGLALTR